MPGSLTPIYLIILAVHVHVGKRISNGSLLVSVAGRVCEVEPGSCCTPQAVPYHMIAALLTPLTAIPPPCNIPAVLRKRLVFGAPNIVAGPPTDRPAARILNGGPFWDKVRRLSATHALGNQFGLIATTDGGATWSPLTFNDSCTACTAGTNLGVDVAPLDGFHDLGSLNITLGFKGNLTGLRSLASTRYFLGADGRFARELGAGATIEGLPNLRMLGWSGDSLRLADGSLVLVAKSILADGPARLSCVALRSVDGGFSWRYASVVAAAEEVPYAAEGPSEASLALLPNGTLLAVMRVEGQSGHYAPYVSQLSTTHHPPPTYSPPTTYHLLPTALRTYYQSFYYSGTSPSSLTTARAAGTRFALCRAAAVAASPVRAVCALGCSRSKAAWSSRAAGPTRSRATSSCGSTRAATPSSGRRTPSRTGTTGSPPTPIGRSPPRPPMTRAAFRARTRATTQSCARGARRVSCCTARAFVASL